MTIDQKYKKQVLYPGVITRLIASMFDLIILGILTNILLLPITQKIFYHYLGSNIANFDWSTMNVKYDQLLQYFIWYLILNILFSGAYFVLFWRYCRTTPGKLLFNLQVTSNDMNNLSISQCIKRFIGYFIFPIGIWFMFFNHSARSLHDNLANSLVSKK